MLYEQDGIYTQKVDAVSERLQPQQPTAAP